jgi:O-antigen/teichoic acid export membrane protein
MLAVNSQQVEPEEPKEPRNIDLLPSLRKRLLSGGLWAFGSRFATAFTAFVTNVFLARLLSPQDLGAYFLAFSVVSVGSLVGLLGLDQAVVRLMAESVDMKQFERARYALGRVLSLAGLGAVGAALTYLLFGKFLETHVFRAPALVAVTGLVAAWIVVVALQLLIAEVFRGLHDIRLASIFFSLGNGVLLTTSLGVLWLLVDQTTLSSVLLLAIGSSLISTILAAWLLHRKVTSFPSESIAANIEGFGDLLRLAWPLLVMNVTLIALGQGYVDLWIIGAFLSEQDVAIFGAAARAVTLVVLPILIVNSVVSPLISGMYAQGRTQHLERALRATATLAAIPTLLTWAAFLLFGGPVLGLLFGPFYSEGAVVLALLGTGQLANVLVGPCGATLTMTGHQRVAMLITVAGGLLIVVAALALVVPYGTTGVAAATASGIVVTNVAYWLAVRRNTGMWTHAGFGIFFHLLKTATNVASRSGR